MEIRILSFRILAIGAAATLVAAILFIAFSQRAEPAIKCENCNVILLVVENLRPDHLGLSGYKRDTSPSLDGFFRAKGIIFKNVFSPSFTTVPSFMSLLTGLDPVRHGVWQSGSPPLSGRWRTAAEVLKLYGYKTYGFYDTSAPLGVDGAYGNARGFDEYRTYGQGLVRFSQNPENLFSFIRSLRSDKFFLLLYTLELHDPYFPRTPYNTVFLDPDYRGRIPDTREEFRALALEHGIDFKSSLSGTARRLFYWSLVDKENPQDIERLKALYDGGIRSVDQFFGELLRELGGSDLLGNTVIIVTAPHGEEFGEHGGFVHQQVYNEVIKVPLLIYVPGAEQRLIKEYVGLIDIMPTFLSLVGAAVPAGIDGRDLRSLMAGSSRSSPHPYLFPQFYTEKEVITTGWKLIKKINRGSDATFELFNLEKDPAEKVNLIGRGFDREEELRNTLKEREKAEERLGKIKTLFLDVPFIGYPP